MVICPSCGAECADNSKYCSQCAALLIVTHSTPDDGISSGALPSQKIKKPIYKSVLFWVAVGAAVLTLILILGSSANKRDVYACYEVKNALAMDLNNFNASCDIILNYSELAHDPLSFVGKHVNVSGIVTNVDMSKNVPIYTLVQEYSSGMRDTYIVEDFRKDKSQKILTGDWLIVNGVLNGQWEITYTNGSQELYPIVAMIFG